MSIQLNINSKDFNLANFGTGWIIFFSIVFQKLTPIGFALLIISLFIKRNQKLPVLNVHFWKNPAFWFISYYLLLIIGMTWSENIQFGLSKLENKLTFILFPIISVFSMQNLKINQLKSILIWALFTSLIIAYILATWNVLNDNTSPFQVYFLGSNFSQFMHRSYFACYLLIGVIFLLDQIRVSFNFWKLFLILMFGFGIIQTESKAGVLSLFLVLSVYGYIFMLKRKRWFGWVLFSGLVFIFVLIFVTNNSLKTRFDTTWSAIENIKTENNPSIESNTARIIMWKTSLEIWKENFAFGTGTGDYNDVLTKRNREKGNTGVAQEELNSHNQFLNSAVQLGILGLIILTMIFISAFVISIHSTWKLLIITTFFINFLVESFIETQAGIILFCVILTLFLKNDTSSTTKPFST